VDRRDCRSQHSLLVEISARRTSIHKTHDLSSKHQRTARSGQKTGGVIALDVDRQPGEDGRMPAARAIIERLRPQLAAPVLDPGQT